MGAGPHDFYIPSPFGEQFFEFMQAACECLEIDYEEIDTEDETCKALVDEKYTFTSAWNQQDVRAKMDEFGTILEDHGYDLKIYDEEDQTMKLTMSKR